MSSRTFRLALVDQRGIALPLALVVLTLLTSLTLAFLAMSASEPLIAANLKGSEQALMLAEAGIERAIWALSNPIPSGVTNPAAAPYNGQQLAGFGPGAYTIAITPGPGPNDRTLVAHGYIARGGVVMPAQPGALAQSDIAAHRVVQLRVSASGPNNTVGGPGTPNDVKLPGALTVAGTLQMAGNSTIDGNDQAKNTPNSCAKKAGVTIRDKTTLPDNACPTPPCVVTNSITASGSAQTSGTVAVEYDPSKPKLQGSQKVTTDEFQPYVFTTAQLAALKALAQTPGQGTYIKPSNSSEFDLTVVDGLMFVDTVNGQSLSTPPAASQLANVKITGASNSGWLIVMGSIRIDGNVTYNGFVYAHNDLSYKGSGAGGIYGGVLTGNVVDAVATVVDSDTSGNAKIYYDCNKVASGGGALTQTVQDSLNLVIVNTITKGTWREVSN